jgi:hypothetical protein
MLSNPASETSAGSSYSYLMSIRKLRMRHEQFPIRKRGVFRPGKEVKELRGGVLLYAAQSILKIDAARVEKNRFRTETT